jgi:curved DNA-binding protein CbpA
VPDSGKSYTGLGSVDVVPSLFKTFNPGNAGLSPEDYFLLTRVDGRTSYRQLVLISGFVEDQAVGIQRKLRERGALLHPGETVPPAPPPPPPPAPPPPPTLPTVDPADPRLAEDVDLTPAQKIAIVGKHLSLKSATYFQVLDLPSDATRKAVKAAYFKISRDFHPDRHYGKRLGSFKQMLTDIFNVAASAHEVLSDDERREGYLLSLSVPAPIADPPSGRLASSPIVAAATGNVARSSTSSTSSTSSRVPHAVRAQAAELFEAACMDQVSGEPARALEGFATAIAADPQPRYLRRAAECALQAQELSKAEEYAKKARDMDARNPSSHRIMSKVHVAKGQIDEARGCLAEALRLDPGNPHILAELKELDKLKKR